MKKIIIFILVIMLLVGALCGCLQDSNGAVEETKQETSNETETQNANQIGNETTREQISENEDIEVPNTNSYSFDSFVCELSESSNIIQVDSKASEFKAVQYSDSSAPKTMQIILLDNEYTLTYENSEYQPMYDQYFHIYKGYDIDNGFHGIYPPCIYVDANTGHIARYVAFPYETMPKTEVECMALLKTVIGDNIDLNEYKYTAFTRFRIPGDYSTPIYREDGFYYCNENEAIIDYNLCFFKEVDGIITSKQVFAIFDTEIFTINVFMPDYDEKIFSGSMRNTEEYEKSLMECVSNQINSKYIVEECTVLDRRLFVKEGVPYVSSDVEVKLKLDKSSDESFEMLLLIVTEIKIENTARE